MWDTKNLRFSTSIAAYLINGTSQVHSYYWWLIGNHRYPIQLSHFRWPWVTFKGGTPSALFLSGFCLCSYRLIASDQIRNGKRLQEIEGFYGASHAPRTGVARLQCSQIFRDLYLRPHCYTKSDQVRRDFYGWASRPLL